MISQKKASCAQNISIYVFSSSPVSICYKWSTPVCILSVSCSRELYQIKMYHNQLVIWNEALPKLKQFTNHLRLTLIDKVRSSKIWLELVNLVQNRSILVIITIPHWPIQLLIFSPHRFPMHGSNVCVRVRVCVRVLEEATTIGFEHVDFYWDSTNFFQVPHTRTHPHTHSALENGVRRKQVIMFTSFFFFYKFQYSNDNFDLESYPIHDTHSHTVYGQLTFPMHFPNRKMHEM